MNIKSFVTIFFSGLGTALFIWLLSFLSENPSPTYCQESYLKPYPNIKSFKKELLIEAKQKVVRNNFKAELDKVSQGNKALRNIIINSSAKYIGSEPIYFNSQYELGKTCVYIDSNDYISLFREHLFDKKKLTGKRLINNENMIKKDRVGDFFNNFIEDLKVEIIKDEYKKVNISNRKIISSLLHNFTYEIKNKYIYIIHAMFIHQQLYHFIILLKKL